MTIFNQMEKYIDIIDKGLKTEISHNGLYQQRIFESMEYSLFTGGKRLRPIMAIKSFELFSGDMEKILPFAMAIEMIHTYSLIHDDLPSMDNDDFRRGKPTNHKIFGEAMAILTGDGLLNLAFETMLKCSNNSKSLEDFKRCNRAMKEVSHYAGVRGMIGGQVLDLMGSFENMDKDKLMFMYKTKTAGLIQASFVAGAIMGGANEVEIEALREYGLNLGLAYQIRDDILDLDGDNEIDKFTYLKYYNLENAKKQVEYLSHKAISTLDVLVHKDTRFLKELANVLVNRDI